MTLVVHRGGWFATKADLAAVPVPEPTESYQPVPYGRFVEEVELHVPRFGLQIESEQFALAREGRQMFGVLTCANGVPNRDHALSIGLSSSYDRSVALKMCSGHTTLVCDNLAFSGEVQMQRKHTAHVFRDLPDLIYRMLSQVSSLRQKHELEIQDWKGTGIGPERAHHLMIEAVKNHILPASRLPKVLEAWEEPKHDEFRSRSAWSLFNAFTEVLKIGGPRVQMDGSLRLSQLFRRELSLN